MSDGMFKYTYSSLKNKEIERIRQKYLPMEEDKLMRLRKLDRKVQTAGMLEALVLGIIGVLIFGIGMCFFLEVFSGDVWMATALFVTGFAFMIPAYPVFKRIARKTKEKLVPEIMKLADELIKK